MDPCGGADVLSVRDADGHEVLFRPHWQTEPTDRGRDDQSWVKGWRGGWTLLFPNAGPACVHGGRRHPYHGDAALSEWEAVDSASDRLSLRYVDVGGATVEREHRIGRRHLSIATTIANPTDRQIEFIAVEHLILGAAFVRAAAAVDLPAGAAPDPRPGFGAWRLVEPAGVGSPEIRRRRGLWPGAGSRPRS